MLITKKVKIKWSGNIRKHYESLGYVWTKLGDEFEVDVNHLTPGSHAIVEWKCDGENCDEVITGEYRDYLKCVKKYGKSYCKSCRTNLFGVEKMRKTILKNSISIGQWAIDNNLFNHIDLEKNREEGIDVFNIPYKSGLKIWFKCLEKDYHDSYKRRCCDFVNGSRCPYCAGKKVHPKDSLAQSVIDMYDEEYLWKIWNKELNGDLDPFTIAPHSHKKVWWNCHNGKHKPYLRGCSNSTIYKYKCHECYEYPTGENHPNWNPSRSEDERGRDDKKYKQFVKDVMTRDNYTCQITGVRGCRLEVHHLNGYHWDKENRLNPDNAITLSKEIHILFHKLYGNKNNTEEQFNDFLMKIELGEINISNI